MPSVVCPRRRRIGASCIAAAQSKKIARAVVKTRKLAPTCTSNLPDVRKQCNALYHRKGRHAWYIRGRTDGDQHGRPGAVHGRPCVPIFLGCRPAGARGKKKLADQGLVVGKIILPPVRGCMRTKQKCLIIPWDETRVETHSIVPYAPIPSLGTAKCSSPRIAENTRCGHGQPCGRSSSPTKPTKPCRCCESMIGRYDGSPRAQQQ